MCIYYTFRFVVCCIEKRRKQLKNKRILKKNSFTAVLCMTVLSECFGGEYDASQAEWLEYFFWPIVCDCDYYEHNYMKSWFRCGCVTSPVCGPKETDSPIRRVTQQRCRSSTVQLPVSQRVSSSRRVSCALISFLYCSRSLRSCQMVSSPFAGSAVRKQRRKPCRNSIEFHVLRNLPGAARPPTAEGVSGEEQGEVAVDFKVRLVRKQPHEVRW